MLIDDVFCQSFATPNRVDLTRAETVDVPESVRQAIIDGDLERLIGLLGEHADTVMRDLVREYWNVP